MQALKRKAGSQRGASITFALLLFLVCAIISSVVIVAATAAGGRASKMAEMDQRYYAVNSAAELLRDVLEEQAITVTLEKDSTFDADQSGKEIDGTRKDDPPLDPVVKLNDSANAMQSDDISASLLAAASLQVTPGVTNPPTLPSSFTLTATSTSEKLDTDALAVIITPELIGTSSKTLRLLVTNKDAESGSAASAGNAYTLTLTFKPSVSQSDDSTTSIISQEPKLNEYGEPIYIRHMETKDIKTTTVRWILEGLQTQVAAIPTKEPTP